MKTIERQIIKKYEEQVEILRRMKDDSGLGYPPSKFIKDINRSEELDNEISALKSQLKDTEPELKQPDPLLKESGGKLNKPEVKTAEKFVNKKLGDKNYTHSPYTMYREEIVKWLNEFASQFQEQPITVTDEMIEKYAYSVELDQNVSIWEKIVNAAKWALSLKAQKAQPGDEEIEVIPPTDKEITIAYSVLAFQYELSEDNVRIALQEYIKGKGKTL